MENQTTPRSLDEAKQHFRQSWQNAVNDPLAIVRETTRRYPWVSVAVAGAAGVVAERGIPVLLKTVKAHPEWLLILVQQLITIRKK
jgi:ElaB/YqjD/DUF883 family membrane-anchored ribosome-binding protein